MAISHKGEVADQYLYSPYGIEEPLTASGNPFRYTDQRYDPESGYFYYKARYYDPVLGRFLQTDPVGYADQYNLYAYVGNDPLNFNDPNGAEHNAVRDFFQGALSVPVAYKTLSMHAANRVGTKNMRAQAHRIEFAIVVGSQVLNNDRLEAGELAFAAANDKGLAYFGGRTAVQSAITLYGVRKLVAKSQAQKVAASLGVGGLNFTATQAGSVLDGFYKLDKKLTDQGLELGQLTVDAAAALITPLAAGSSIDFDSDTGEVSVIVERSSSGRAPRRHRQRICKFEEGKCS